MIFVDDSTIKIGGVILSGIVRSLEIKTDARVEEQEVEGKSQSLSKRRAMRMPKSISKSVLRMEKPQPKKRNSKGFKIFLEHQGKQSLRFMKS